MPEESLHTDDHLKGLEYSRRRQLLPHGEIRTYQKPPAETPLPVPAVNAPTVAAFSEPTRVTRLGSGGARATSILDATRFNIIPAGESYAWGWPGPVRMVLAFPTREVLARTAGELGLAPEPPELRAELAASDPFVAGTLWALGRSLEVTELQGTNADPDVSLYRDTLVRGLAAHLITRHARRDLDASIRPATGLEDWRLQRVEGLIRADLTASLRLEDLARAAMLSPYHFARRFKAATGESPAAFVRHIRISEAARLIRTHPATPLGEVATLVGYGSGAGFTRAFRRHMGATPRAYRREFGA